MDIDETHAAAKIMLEYDGCIMQRQARGTSGQPVSFWGVKDTGWHDVPLSSAGNWDWVTFLYRKKPEPKTIWSFNCESRVRPEPIECWVNVIGDMCSTVHMTKEDAAAILRSGKDWTMRKFREVIE